MLGARVELGVWCGSRVSDRKIRHNEAFGSQSMKRLVATIERAFPKATVDELEARGLAVHTRHKRQPDREFREPRAS